MSFLRLASLIVKVFCVVWQTRSAYPNAAGIGLQALLELPSGLILSVGGESVQPPGYAETLEPNSYLYNPVTDSWTLTTGAPTIACDYPALVLLNNGKVLKIGGRITDVSGNATAGCELYDPSTGLWTPTGSLNTARVFFGFWKLPTGDVLVAGGGTNPGSFNSVATTELYSVSGGTWANTGFSLLTPTLRPFFFSLPNGTPVIAGGYNNTSGGYIGGVNGTFAYSAGSGWLSISASPIGIGTQEGGAGVILPNGDFFLTGAASNVAGGTLNNAVATTMIFHVGSDTWETVGSLNNARTYASVGVLPTSHVFVSGGWTFAGAVLTGELYDPVAKTWALAPSYVGPAVHQVFSTFIQTRIGSTSGVYTIGGSDFTQTPGGPSSLYPTTTTNIFFPIRSLSPMSASEPNYQVVFNTDTGLQYVFATGLIAIPEAPLNAITALTGDVIATGPGSAVASVPKANAAILNKDTVGSIAGTGTVTPNASMASIFEMTVSGDVTLNGPANPTDGQKVLFVIANDASHSVSLATGAGNFAFGTDITSYTNSVSKTDLVGAIYNATIGKWLVFSVIQGF